MYKYIIFFGVMFKNIIREAKHYVVGGTGTWAYAFGLGLGIGYWGAEPWDWVFVIIRKSGLGADVYIKTDLTFLSTRYLA